MSKKSQEFGRKLKDLLESHNMKQCELSQKLNTTDTTISKYINGIQLPRYSMLQDIANLFEVSVDYLLGIDPISYQEVTPNESEILELPVIRHLHYHDSLSEPNQENIVEYYEISKRKYKNHNSLFAVMVHSDNMEPRILKGDIALCETISITDKLQTGDIVIVTFGDEEAVCREISEAKDGITLNTWNLTMPPIYYSNETMRTENIHIIGRVIKLVVNFIK